MSSQSMGVDVVGYEPYIAVIERCCVDPYKYLTWFELRYGSIFNDCIVQNGFLVCSTFLQDQCFGGLGDLRALRIELANTSSFRDLLAIVLTDILLALQTDDSDSSTLCSGLGTASLGAQVLGLGSRYMSYLPLFNGEFEAVYHE